VTKSRVMRWLCAAAVVGAVSVYAFNPVVGADESDEAETALVESARKAFQSAQDAFENDMITMEDFYHWSRRLMQAELKVNPSNKKAKLDHLRIEREITSRFGIIAC
jgi:outer membrane protein TolC